MIDKYGNTIRSGIVTSEAVFDRDDSSYRYSLLKEWDDTPGKLCAVAVLYNPGDGFVHETSHTVNNMLLICMTDKHYGSLQVVNLYAKIGKEKTYPDREIYHGKHNLAYIEDVVLRNPRTVGMLIAGWGSYARPTRHYEKQFMKILARFDGPIMCLGHLDRHMPAHPSRAESSKLIAYKIPL